MSTELAMFPLGTVLFPYEVLPLHVFEPRYQVMLERCLADDGRFGVVLIERGSEVGGGDTRFDLGTVARIDDIATLPEGRSLVMAVGLDRARVLEWLPDDPYPRALVERVDDPPEPADLADRLAEVHRRLEQVRALSGELGIHGGSTETDPPTQQLADDPVVAAYQLCARAPLGPLDAQRLLAAPTATARLDELAAALAELATLLRAQLGR